VIVGGVGGGRVEIEGKEREGFSSGCGRIEEREVCGGFEVVEVEEEVRGEKGMRVEEEAGEEECWAGGGRGGTGIEDGAGEGGRQEE